MTSDVAEWYGDLYDEDSRLADHPLEYIRVKRIISRYLTDAPMAIADVGGASGIYSFWLAELGHEVSLVDLTPRHIELARARADATGNHLHSYHCADARHLPFDDATFDLVLEMGPLYHLQNRNDRLDVLREACRVLKPGHLVMCQVISRWASLIDGFQYGFVADAYFREIMINDMATGCHNNPQKTDHYFTTAYFHRPNEIKEELEQTGLSDISLLAVEGFATGKDTEGLLADPVTASALMDCLDETEITPELLGVSSHIMAIGLKR